MSCIILLLLLDFIIVVRLLCLLFDFLFILSFDFCSHLILCFSLFHCSKEKDSILILDCIPGISIPLNHCCSVSRWRPHKVDKRMVLEYTHGLFIT
jgi:hypothetical protein